MAERECDSTPVLEGSPPKPGVQEEPDDGEPVVTDPSPPGSPAAKKRKKDFLDYVREDDEKKEKEKSKTPSPAKKESREIIKPGEQLPWWRSSKMGMGVILGVAALLVAVPATHVSYFRWEGQPQLAKVNYTWKNATSTFNRWARPLQKQFPKQNRETWIQLIASIRATLEKTEPEHPSSITVLLPPSLERDFVSCFLKRVGNVVNQAVGPILQGFRKKPAAVREIDPSTFTKTSISEFHSAIKNYFEKQGKVLITWDVDKFQTEEELLVFHALCDNYKAIDKRAVLLFPLQVSPATFSKFEWIHARGGDISNDVLSDGWKTVLSPDVGPALQARVADAVILLNEGDNCLY